MSIVIRGLEKRFGEKVLFTGLDLTVDTPAVLWAPSGWGKTTLLRILMGLEPPTAGTVQGVGRVGAVFQEDRLCPHLTAVQNAALVLPGPPQQYHAALRADFAALGMEDAALHCLRCGCPAGRSAALLWCGRSGPRATPCCWTSPLPGWTRRP